MFDDFDTQVQCDEYTEAMAGYEEWLAYVNGGKEYEDE